MELTERARQTLLLVISILALICFFSSFMLFACAAYIKIKVDARMKLIVTYNSDVLPGIFLFVGVINLAQNVTFLFVCLKLRTVESREGLMRMLLPVLIGGLILVIFEVSASIASFVHMSILDKEFGNGLTTAMEEYVKGGELKVEMDTVQSEYGCCGDLDYTEWFQHSWIDPQYLKVSQGGAKKYFHTDGKYYSDDTPFSCCDIRSPRPCIHHHIHDNSRHHNYNHMVETTLYVRGCREVLMEIYSGVLLTVAIIALIIASFKTTALMLFRLVQTSLVKAQEADDWEATTPAYIYYPAPNDGDLEKKLLEGDSDTVEEKTDNEGEDTSEHTNTDNEEVTGSSDITPNEEDTTNNEIATNANNYSDDIYYNYGKDGRNKSNNKPAWRPLPHLPMRQWPNYFDENVSSQVNPNDSCTSNRNVSQPWAFQNSGLEAECVDEFYEKGNYIDNNYFGDGRTKCHEMSKESIKTYQHYRKGQSASMLNVNAHCVPANQIVPAYGNGGDYGVNDGTFANPDANKQPKIDRDVPSKQVKFHTQKPRLIDGHRGFPTGIFSHLISRNKRHKTYKTSDNHKYSLVSVNSDIEEYDEEEDLDDEEDSNSVSECNNYPSDNNDTDNRDQDCQSWVRNEHHTLQENSQKVISDRQSQNNVLFRHEVHRDSQAAHQETNEYRRKDDHGSSETKSLPEIVNSDSPEMLAEVQVPCYHEENEVSNFEGNELRLRNVKQQHGRKSKSNAVNFLTSKPVHDNTTGQGVLELSEQTMCSKTMPVATNIQRCAEMVFNRPHPYGLPPFTTNRAVVNQHIQQNMSSHIADNTSSDISTDNSALLPSSRGQRLPHEHRMTSAQSDFDENRFKHNRLSELVRRHESSETESELAGIDPHTDGRQRFIGRSTPFPYEVLRYEATHSEEYDLIPTNIRRNKESTLDYVCKSLAGMRNDNTELSTLKVDIPESDVEYSNFTHSSTTDAVDCHHVQKQIHEEKDITQLTTNSRHLHQKEQHQERHVEDKNTDKLVSSNKTSCCSYVSQLRSHNLDTNNQCARAEHKTIKKEFLLDSKCATSSSFSFPLMLPSPSSHEFASSGRNHVRSYQRRSVFLASPFSSVSSNSPVTPHSPHIALFSSPFIDSPMETSTPILSTKRLWDSLSWQAVRTPVLDNNTVQSFKQVQETNLLSAISKTNETETVAINSKRTNDAAQSKHQANLPVLTDAHPRNPTADQQRVSVERIFPIKHISERPATPDPAGKETAKEQSHGQGRVLISPFN